MDSVLTRLSRTIPGGNNLSKVFLRTVQATPKALTTSTFYSQMTLMFHTVLRPMTYNSIRYSPMTDKSQHFNLSMIVNSNRFSPMTADTRYSPTTACNNLSEDLNMTETIYLTETMAFQRFLRTPVAAVIQQEVLTNFYMT